MKIQYFYFILTLVFISSCNKDNPILKEDEDINLGGETTINTSFIKIFQQPAPNLSATELDFHRKADIAFGDIFVTSPSTINPGLGPIFNQNSCESCHVSNGKSPFPLNPDDLRGLLMRVSLPGNDAIGEPNILPGFGRQLQTKAVFGKAPEGKMSWQEIEMVKNYLDGTSITLRQLKFNIENPYISLPPNIHFSARIAPAIIGLGLLEAIDENDILSFADPDDKNQDGISARPNYGWDYKAQKKTLGRFGWKAAQPNLLQQTAAAYNNDMGITSPYFSQESSYGQTQFDGNTDDPEISEETLKAATFYSQSLAVPKRRNWNDPTVKRGKILFSELNCSSCHRPKYITGQHPEFSFLSNQTIFPYTDLLLHDMGNELSDNRPDFDASGNEWRTPPLWGVGLTKTVGGHTNFLHDGRARSLEEAIMWHGGEAEKSKEDYRKLPKSDREAVVKFLESL